MGDIVSLTEVRTHLRYPASNVSDDVGIQGFIEAATEVIEFHCGIVTPQQFVEFYDGGDYTIHLRHIPVLTVESIEEGWGWIDEELTYQQVNTVPASSMFAFSIDMPSAGQISRRSAGNVLIPFMPGVANIRVAYTAGRSKVPGDLRLAALELIAHWWQQSQQRSGASLGATMDNDMEGSGDPYAWYGVPPRILDMIKTKPRLPVIG